MNNSRIIIPLDFSSEKNATEFLKKIEPESCRLKIGKELFTSAGPSFVRKLIGEQFCIFLDLKFHDIPSTVAKACIAASELGVWMINIHASGGERMMMAAREAVDKQEHKPILIAVTVLTSMNQNELVKTGIHDPIKEHVLRLSELSFTAGLDGVVCSAQEAHDLRKRFGKDFCIVTPGIRPDQSSKDDQDRTMSPVEAIKAGSDFLVIGRPITQAKDPSRALKNISDEINQLY